MSVSYWETTPTVYEARVHHGDVLELTMVGEQMATECIKFNGSTEDLSWKIDGDSVVISFPAGSSSVGWSPDA